MALLDPRERSERGTEMQIAVTGQIPAEPRTLVEESWRDFIYAEVWTQPAMSRRARYLVALASSVLTAAEDAILDDYVRGALKSGELTVAELREAALHLGPYGGWPRAAKLDKSITRMVQSTGAKGGETAPIRAESWDPVERDARGSQEFNDVMTFPHAPPVSPYLQAINNFVFGEMWTRRALDEPSRRWLTLVGVCDAGIEVPIHSHVHAAMASGNCKPDELQEFVLQFALFHGWPKASQVQAAVFAMIKKVEAGLPWNG